MWNRLLNDAGEKETKLHVSPFTPLPRLALNGFIPNTVINIINLRRPNFKVLFLKAIYIL